MQPRLGIAALLVIALARGAVTEGASVGFAQTNLVSDIPGLALNTDSSLKNPWGSPRSPRPHSGSPTRCRGLRLSTTRRGRSRGSS